MFQRTKPPYSDLLAEPDPCRAIAVRASGVGSTAE
jgi:hypothetical protein